MAKFRFHIQAVIFDMDGVIVDSMPYHFLTWYEALKPYGIRVSCFDVYSREGERWEKTLRELFSRNGIKPTNKVLREVFALRKKIFKKYFQRFIFPEARELLVYLKQEGYILGLVTGTPGAEVTRILPAEIRSLFDCIVAGDQVKRGKPDPQPYLYASRSLNIPPASCVVVENAPLGIESAKRAGMFCVALTTSLPKDYLQGADAVAEQLSEIPGIIKGKCVLKRGKAGKFSIIARC